MIHIYIYIYILSCFQTLTSVDNGLNYVSSVVYAVGPCPIYWVVEQPLDGMLSEGRFENRRGRIL